MTLIAAGYVEVETPLPPVVVDVTRTPDGTVDVHSAPHVTIGGSGATRYVHTQTSPAAQWTIPHGLAAPTEPVILLDGLGGQPVYTDTVHDTAARTTTLTFPTPVTGKAYL